MKLVMAAIGAGIGVVRGRRRRLATSAPPDRGGGVRVPQSRPESALAP